MREGWIEDREVEALTGLLADLRKEGWSIGTAQMLAAHNLLIGVHEGAGELPSLQTLSNWIGPIVCKSGQQQRDFPNRLAVALAGVRDEPPPRARTKHEKRLSIAAFVLAAIGIAALVAAIWFAGHQTMEPKKEFTQSPLDAVRGPGQPVSIAKYSATAAGALGGAALMIFAWWLLRRRNAEAALRKVISRDPSIQEIFHGVPAAPLESLDFRRVAQVMRRRRFEESKEVDVAGTIEATAARAGYFVPVFRQRAEMPEYAVMIDRRTAQDVQAKVFEFAAAQLGANGVVVDVFFFDRDPRICWRQGKARERFRFDSIASAYGNHHLLLVGDGEGMVDPRSGRPARWVRSFFAGFRDACVLTPRPAMQWDQHELFLAESGAIVLPASADGILAYVSRDERGRRPAVPYGSTMMPLLLESDETVWLSSVEPPAELIRQLIDDLEIAIGRDAMRWLAASAIYPAVEWSVLLFLGKELRVPDLEENLLALARLPWLRRGQMPDWLRIRLLWTLDGQTEKHVRKLLFDLFDDLVVRESRATVRISRFGDLANAVPAGSRLSEHVMADFMSGRTPKSLSLSIPQRFVRTLERFFSRGKQRRLDPNWKALVLAYTPLISAFLMFHREEKVRLLARYWTVMTALYVFLAAFVMDLFGSGGMPAIVVLVPPWIVGSLIGMREAILQGQLPWLVRFFQDRSNRVATRPRGRRDTVFQRIAGVLFRPTETFGDIAERPDVLRPMLLLMLLTFGNSLVMVPRTDLESTIQEMQKKRPMSDEQVASARRIQTAAAKVIGYAAPATVLAGWVLLAAIFLLVCKLSSGRTTYKQVFAVVLYAWWPQMIYTILLDIAVLARGVIDASEVATLIKSNPAFLADRLQQPVLFAFLLSLDVFTFWTLYLLIVGLAVSAEISKWRIGTWVMALWGALGAVRVLLAVLQS